MVDAKRARRMETVDAMTAEWRVLVHGYGFTIIDALLCCGVTKAKHARHIIETILNEMSATRGGFSSQGARSLEANQMVLISKEPTEAMIEASMATVSSYDMTVTKREKHRLRLKAAIDAATRRRR